MMKGRIWGVGGMWDGGEAEGGRGTRWGRGGGGGIMEVGLDVFVMWVGGGMTMG